MSNSKNPAANCLVKLYISITASFVLLPTNIHLWLLRISNTDFIAGIIKCKSYRPIPQWADTGDTGHMISIISISTC